MFGNSDSPSSGLADIPPSAKHLYLQAIFDHAMDCMVVLNDMGCCVDINAAACAMLGYDRRELLGLQGSYIVQGNPGQNVQEEWTEFLRQGRHVSECVMVRKDGTRINCELHSVANIVPGLHLTIWRDISDRKRIENSLRGSEKQHRTLLANIPDVVMRFDRDGRHLYASKNVQLFSDTAAAMFIGKTPRELGFPEHICVHWENVIRKVLNTARPYHGEFSLHGSRGPMLFDWRVLPEYDDNGEVCTVLSIARDITEYTKLAADYQSLFDGMLDGFAIHEIIRNSRGRPVDYRFLAVNPSFERMTGLKAVDIVGRRVRDVMPNTESYWIENYGNVAITGNPIRFEGCAKSLGKYFEVHAYRPQEGQFACIFRDITDRKMAEKERDRLQALLLQSQKMEAIGRLAAGVAHDFNNQLTVIQGYCDLLLADHGPDDPIWSPITEIRKAGARAHSTTRHLLSFSRKQILRPEPTILGDLLQDMRGPVAKIIGEDIEFVIQTLDTQAVFIDRSTMNQAVMNLIVNARDAMPNGGQILCKTQDFIVVHGDAEKLPEVSAGQYVRLDVSDTGTGMDKRTMEHIFDPFFTTKEVGKGTGLGLPMVQGFIRQSHGAIFVRSKKGAGTTVSILLPVGGGSQPVADDDNKNSPADQRKGGKMVVVVEDDCAVRTFVVNSLRASGYNVLEAGAPSNAIEIALEFNGLIDLLITDMVMPEMNGAELAGKIKAIRKSIRTLFITGYQDEVDVNKAGNILFKPFTTDDLLLHVYNTLQQKWSADKP